MVIKIRKLQTVGAGSTAMTLPVDFVRESGVKSGDKVYVISNRRFLIVALDKKQAQSFNDIAHEGQHEYLKAGIKVAVEEATVEDDEE